MSTINGFMSFYHDMESLYWQRICNLMKDKSTKEDEQKMFSLEKGMLCVSKKGSVFEDRDYICLFAGNLSNRKMLTDKLKDLGVTAGEKESEIFLYIYKALGIRGSALCFGEFSAVIYNKQENRLILFRDKVGTYPLYYAYVNGRFAFSSSINSLLRFPGVNPVINERGLCDIFCMPGRSNQTDTFFENIKRVPCGNALIFDKEGILLKEYYSLKPSDRFNLSFLARDSIRQREGEKLKPVKEIKSADYVFSAIDLTDACAYPVYGSALDVTAHIKNNKKEKIMLPFLPASYKESRVSSLLLKENLKGVDISRRKTDSMIIYGIKDFVLSCDSARVFSREKRIFDIKTYFSNQVESLIRYCEMTGKEITFPLQDARVMECVADGGGEKYILPREFLFSDKKESQIRQMVKNEMTGERPVYEIIDKEKTNTFIEKESIQDIVYLLSIDYFINRFHVTFSFIK